MKTRLLIFAGILMFLVIACSKDDNPKDPDPINQPDQKPNPLNKPPATFTLLTVVDNGMDVDPKPTFTWNETTDPDGDKVTYSLYLDKSADPITLVADGLATSTFTMPDDEALSLAQDYFWKVVAKDGKGGETSSVTFEFKVRRLKNAQQLTVDDPFTAVDRHESVIFDDKMWVLGGFTFEPNQEVWNSNNGITWAQPLILASEIFSKRFFHEALVFDSKMWVIGGNGDSGFLNDAWSSANGSSWAEVTQVNFQSVGNIRQRSLTTKCGSLVDLQQVP